MDGRGGRRRRPPDQPDRSRDHLEHHGLRPRHRHQGVLLAVRHLRLGGHQGGHDPQDRHRGRHPHQRQRGDVHLLRELGRPVPGDAGIDRRGHRRRVQRNDPRARHRQAERHLQDDGHAGRRLPQLLHPGARRRRNDGDLPDHRGDHAGRRHRHHQQLQLRLPGDGARRFVRGRRRRHRRRHGRQQRHRWSDRDGRSDRYGRSDGHGRRRHRRRNHRHRRPGVWRLHRHQLGWRPRHGRFAGHRRRARHRRCDWHRRRRARHRRCDWHRRQ